MKKKGSNGKNTLQDLTIRQKELEREVARITKLKDASNKVHKERNYQGPMGYGGSGSTDAMPGSSGYTLSQPNIVESLLDILKIKPFEPKKLQIKPKKRPVEKYPGAI